MLRSPLIPLALGAAGLLAGTAPAQLQTRFTDVSAQCGISFTHTDRVDTMAGGLCFLDYDLDDDQDLFVTSRGGGSNVLYRNRGDGTFEDVTASAGVGDVMESMGAYAQDLDNDGDQDLIVVGRFNLRLYENRGDATFVDRNSANHGRNSWAVSATFADYDNDRDLDIYVGNYIADGFFPYFNCYPNLLLRNDGNWQFTEVATQAGVTGEERVWDPQQGWKVTGSATLSCLFHDFDGDGWQDLFVGNDFGPFVIPNQLFRNNQDGTFTEVSRAHDFRIPEFNMGLAVADVNRDGFLDVYTSNFGSNHLLFADGRGRYWDAAVSWRAAEAENNGAMLVSWAAMFLDGDLDGWLDLYVSNGYINAAPSMPADQLAPSRLLMNMGDTYVTLPDPLFPWDREVGRGAACADIDGDGDEDIVQLNNRAALRVYRNDTITSNQAAILSLRGTLSNRDGVGAVLDIRARRGRQVVAYARGGSYGSGNGAPIIRGLGADSMIQELQVDWPSGVTSRRFGLDANVHHEIAEPSVTIVRTESWFPVGADWVEVPVVVENHASAPRSVRIDCKLVLGDLRSTFPAYHLPVTVSPNSTTTARVYLPLSAAAIALGRQLGVWYQLGATDRNGGRDELEQPIR